MSHKTKEDMEKVMVDPAVGIISGAWEKMSNRMVSFHWYYSFVSTSGCLQRKCRTFPIASGITIKITE
jgi:hypothetical protein